MEMTTTTLWSDTPPSDLQPGEYIWFRFRGGEPYPVVYSGEIGDSDEFGPRVLSAEDTVNLTAEVDQLAGLLTKMLFEHEPKAAELGRQVRAAIANHGGATSPEGGAS